MTKFKSGVTNFIFEQDKSTNNLDDFAINILNSKLNKWKNLLQALYSDEIALNLKKNPEPIKIYWVDLMDRIFARKNSIFKAYYNIQSTVDKRDIIFSYAFWDYFETLKKKNKSELIMKNAQFIKKNFWWKILELSQAYIKHVWINESNWNSYEEVVY